MVKTHNSRKRFIAAALGALALGAMAPASAEVNMFDGELHFSVTPYAWLPNVNGSTSFRWPDRDRPEHERGHRFQHRSSATSSSLR